jgi:hypothetical protein
MTHRFTRLAAVATSAVISLGAVASASAHTAPYQRCPLSGDDDLCLVVESTDGSITANNHQLSLAGADVKIEGGLDGNTLAFVPPASGSALTAKPVDVPGGLFDTNLPFNLTSVKATVEQAGPIAYDFFSGTVTAPIRIKFTNPLLGSNCAIGSTASPIVLTLITGTTNPPAPNTPISGTPGTLFGGPGVLFGVEDQVQVDNTFAVPAATGCGAVATRQVTKIINRNLGLPSAAGHYNSASLTLTIGLATY